MKPYLSDIVKLYEDKIIEYLGNSGTIHLLLHIVQCWRAYDVNEENQELPVVVYCYEMAY